MATLYLVRHGRAAKGFGDERDPGLDDVGHAQAASMADTLATRGPLPMMTSPMKRCRETVGSLERTWNTMAMVESAVSEVTAPSDDLAERHAWVQTALRSTWSDLGPRYESWRTMVVEMLSHVRVDSVIVTHFFCINAAISVATGDDRVMCAPVANASVSVFDTEHHTLRLVEVGSTDDSVVG